MASTAPPVPDHRAPARRPAPPPTAASPGPNAGTGLRGPNARTGLRGPNAGTGLRGPNAGTGRRPAPAWEERIAVGPTTPHGRVAWRADLARRRRRDPYAIHHDRRAQAALLAA